MTCIYFILFLFNDLRIEVVLFVLLILVELFTFTV